MKPYHTFLSHKTDYGASDGFTPLWMPEFLFDFQKSLVDWSIWHGRDAIFADCGLGKTPMQLVWAENVVRKTNKPVLVLTPLSVTGQTLQEAYKFGIEAHRAEPSKLYSGINVTNYERLHYFDASEYSGVVCDESSILKNFDGAHKAEITEFMRKVPYRLLCTATAAPNDWIELGTSSEALGYLGYMDMLTRFFVNNNNTSNLRGGRFGRDKWRLKGHAEEPFWRWVCSWARALRKPSDLGYADSEFVLPTLHENTTIVKATRPRDGMLFDVPAVSFHEEREVTRRTIAERCETAAEKVSQHEISMVWCHLNDEGDTLAKLIPDSWQISGQSSEEEREEAIEWFTHGTGNRRLISKSKVFGYGLNLQVCNHVTYFPTHSYEQYYQSVRRCWRFGQTRPVTVDLIGTDGDEKVMANLARKSADADKMFAHLVKNMNNALKVSTTKRTTTNIGVPQWLQSK